MLPFPSKLSPWECTQHSQHFCPTRKMSCKNLVSFDLLRRKKDVRLHASVYKLDFKKVKGRIVEIFIKISIKND